MSTVFTIQRGRHAGWDIICTNHGLRVPESDDHAHIRDVAEVILRRLNVSALMKRPLAQYCMVCGHGPCECLKREARWDEKDRDEVRCLEVVHS